MGPSSMQGLPCQVTACHTLQAHQREGGGPIHHTYHAALEWRHEQHAALAVEGMLAESSVHAL